MILLRVLWTPFGWIFVFIWMLFTTLVCLPLLPFKRLESLRNQLYYRMNRLIPFFALGVVKVEHGEDFDPSQRSIFVMNHTSSLDPFVMTHVVPHPFCGLVNAVQLKMPIYGTLLKLGNAVPVFKRGKGDSSKITTYIRDRIARKLSVVVCPEAHRTRTGKIQNFKRGAFFMARDAGVPIVPVAVRGLYEVLPRGALLLNPGRISAYIGPSIDVSDFSDDQIASLAKRCREFIAAYVERGEIMKNARAFLTSMCEDDAG